MMKRNFLTIVLGSILFLAPLVLAQDGEGPVPSVENEEIMQELRNLRQRVQRLENQVREFALTRAGEQIRELEAEMGERAPEEVAREIERIRAGLERAYISSGDFDVDQQAIGKEVTTGFDSVIRMLEGGEDAATNLEALVSDLLIETRRVAREQARQALQALQRDVEAGQHTPEELAAEARRILAGLERAYASTGGVGVDTTEIGEDVEAGFGSLIEQLEAGEPATPQFDTLMNQLAPTEEESGTESAEASAQEQTETAAGAAEEFEWQELGQQVYASSCSVCHQMTGEGIEGAYPALAGNPFVTGAPVPVIDVVLNGRGAMPAFAGSLTAEEIAAVISHERNTWGNEATIVTPEIVTAVNEGEPVDEMLDTLERPGAAN